MDDRPQWSRRMVAEREARGWSQLDAIRAMRAHSPKPLPDDTSLLRNWKRWEAGDSTPDASYQPLIARAFGTVSAAIWPVTRRRRDHESELMAATGMNTLEIVTRLRASAVDDATLDGMRITADQLSSDYPHLPAAQLLIEGRAWLHRISSLLEHRLTLTQHRAVLTTAGWLTLLVGCIEYDTGDRRAAEATRQAALSLGSEAGNGEIEAWAHEMRCWFDLTTGNYQGVITAAEQGQASAGHSGVAVQLAAQQAKAWARLGDRRQTEAAASSKHSPTQQTSTITSWSTRPNSTSTPWTATGGSARTASPSRSARPGKATSTRPFPTVAGLSVVIESPSRRCGWWSVTSPGSAMTATRKNPRPPTTSNKSTSSRLAELTAAVGRLRRYAEPRSLASQPDGSVISRSSLTSAVH